MKYHIPILFIILTIISSILVVYYVFNLEKTPKLHAFGALCPVKGIITVHEGGRLGNYIWEYASTVAIGQILNFSPYMPSKILKCLGEVFQNLSVPAYEDTILSGHCRLLHRGNVSSCKTPRTEFSAENVSPWDYLCNTLTKGKGIDIYLKPTALLKKMHNDGQLSDVLVLPIWIAHIEAIVKMGVKKFQQLFHFRSDVLDLVNKTITGVLKAKKEVKGEVSLVGIHVRRGDYNAYLVETYGKGIGFVDSNYYKRAMVKMHELKPNITVMFVIVSDDREWCMKNLVNETNGVFWGGMEGSPFLNSSSKQSSNKERAHDLALLASLNGSIISYGTFGVTGALLAGGHTIAFNMSTNAKYMTPFTVSLARQLDNWELMS